MVLGGDLGFVSLMSFCSGPQGVLHSRSNAASLTLVI